MITSVVLGQQHHAQLIVVGDQSQAINEWRGTTNALQIWPAQHRVYLQESFRFGPEIAAEANKWLSLLDTPLRLIGRGGPTRITDAVTAPDAILCRTNAAAMGEAIDAMAAGQRVAVIGGGEQIRHLAEAALELRDRGFTDHPELAVFRTWGEVQHYVQHEADGQELKTVVDLIDRHGADTLLAAVDRLVDEQAAPDLVVSTAHRSKGLEWAKVQIGDDFTEPGLDEDGHARPVTRAMAMLGYVATTRAQQHLGRGGLRWIDQHHHATTADTDPTRPVVPGPATAAPPDWTTVLADIRRQSEAADPDWDRLYLDLRVLWSDARDRHRSHADVPDTLATAIRDTGTATKHAMWRARLLAIDHSDPAAIKAAITKARRAGVDIARMSAELATESAASPTRPTTSACSDEDTTRP